MTREQATELLETFRRDRSEAPAVNARVLAHAYVTVLGSMAREERPGGQDGGRDRE